MDCNTFAHLSDFRQQLYACFHKAGDALFNCLDALLSETPARSLAELSLSPFFVRQWPSVYQSLQQASVDRVALQRLFAAYVALPPPAERLVLGIDASSIARPCSPTAQEGRSALCLPRRRDARPARCLLTGRNSGRTNGASKCLAQIALQESAGADRECAPRGAASRYQ
jgi:hypothetical protein